MQYLLLIYEQEERFANLSKDKLGVEMGDYQAFGKEFASAIQGGDALQPTTTATTVRVREGKRLTTDGPFAETKEQLGGYYLVEAKDLDQAIAIASKIPGARYGCVEVRPIMTFRSQASLTENLQVAELAALCRAEWGRLLSAPDPRPAGLRPGRGRPAGRVRVGAGTAGTTVRPQSGRLAVHGRPAQRDRSTASAGAPGRQAGGDRPARPS